MSNEVEQVGLWEWVEDNVLMVEDQGVDGPKRWRVEMVSHYLYGESMYAALQNAYNYKGTGVARD